MLKNKLFYFVVFAAAAIFAVTFVACDNGSTSTDTEYIYKVALTGVTEGDAVKWTNLQTGDVKYAVADENNLVTAYTGDWAFEELAVAAGYTAGAGTIGKSTSFTANKYYEVVTFQISTLSEVKKFYKAADADTLTATGVVADDIVVSVGAAVEGAAGYTAGAGTIGKSSSFTPDKYYEVVTFQISSLSEVKKFYKAADADTLTATGVVADDIVVSVGSTAGTEVLTKGTHYLHL